MIRIAVKEDLKHIEQIYNEILEYEEKTVSYTNWQKGLYPTVEYAEKALEDKTLFVCEENNKVVGCVILNSIQPKEYENINWITKAEPNDVRVIHTLCISPSVYGKGKGKEVVKFCEEYAREQKAKVIRLDTYEGNTPASIMYPKLGYTYVGITKFHFQNIIWENLKCFEKTL